MNRISCIALGCLVFVSSHLFAAGESETVIAKSAGSNIGFMENPPKELTEKFPMCDVFLKVKWIDKGKMIGYSHFDFYVDGKKKGQMTSLVFLGKSLHSLNLDLSPYEYDGVLQDTFSFIKEGKKVGSDFDLTIRKGDQKITFFPTTTTFSLADGYKMVCVPYPDNERVWIPELRRVGKIYSDQEIEKRYERIKALYPSSSLSDFKLWAAIDLHFDGVEDYSALPQLIVGDRYFEMRKTRVGYHYVEWQFLPTMRICKLQSVDGELLVPAPYWTTDGRSYFYSDQCNLTELTSPYEQK